MKKKPMVRFLELSKPGEVAELEKKINAAIRKSKLSLGPIHLFRHEDGTYGFQAHVSATPGRKKDFDRLYELVMAHLPVTKRGRKPSDIRKIQAKYLLPEDLHQRIKEVAEANDISASELVERCLKKAVGE
jgi:hypothetical protein